MRNVYVRVYIYMYTFLKQEALKITEKEKNTRSKA